MKRTVCISMLGVGVVGVFSVQAQCPPGWLPGTGLPGTGSPASASTVWDPDGDGPARPLLIVAGGFAFAGDQPCGNIAAWDGEEWRPLGAGLNGPVRSLVTFDGDLVACGNFTAAAGTPVGRIARWDGAAWQPLGAGLDASAWLMTVFDGELIVAGSFSHAGGSPAASLARWDGAAWHGFGDVSVTANTMTVYAGELAVGGSFSEPGGIGDARVALWNGSSWRRLAADPPANVRVLTVHDDTLLAVSTWVQDVNMVYRALRWNGATWDALAEGLAANAPPAATAWRGSLHLSGVSSVNGLSTANIVRWSGGTQWQELDGGIAMGGAASLTVYEDELIVAGNFRGAGSAAATHVARWDGAQWRATSRGFDSPVRAVAVFQGSLVAGGAMTAAPGVAAEGVAAWDGSSWHAVGAGLRDSSVHGESAGVGALCAWQGQLLAGGFFGTGSAPAANGVGRWDGAAWRRLGQTFSGGSSYSAVKAIAVISGDPVVAGDFTSIGTSAVNRVARWDGARWVGIGPVGSLGVSGGPAPAASAVIEFGGQIVLAGRFTKAGGADAANIARWDGAAWHALGGGLSGPVSALAEFNGELIAGGAFLSAGGTPAPRLAAWNGSSWRAIGAPDAPVSALAVIDGSLVAAGEFTLIDSMPATRVARWDGAAWSPVDAGLDGAVTCLAAFGDELAAGGSFTAAGAHLSMHFARWSPAPEAPAVGSHPAPASTCPGGTVSFSVQATGTAPFEFRWRRDGVPLHDGLGGGGGRILGAATATLTISGAAFTDAAQYDCEVANTCGSAVTNPAPLTLCAADLDCNSFVNGDDFDAFVLAFTQGEPGADINADGFTNGDDFDIFAAAFEAGC